ncbi:SDR family NAD(P)-dependent oxidoreductase [Fulvivirga maritima]|uniref:SDR family oxidoreductase n=1 Tax=Fulvivirga maritima TaxID=2904247 RepID=UPI001F3C649F|nr:SDR family NAD(P)-dependent oxidoreductase [Fulvivirga maritima]UII26930.1 SDR family NAD(P)-dependent oxidoreductase [Fulvivirga maritima]
MNIKNNTVLVTGGGSGIGLEIAKYFYDHGSEVIICGRRAEVLEEARGAMPNLHILVCDLSNAEERVRLVENILVDFPQLNILVNNAGMQQFINLNELHSAEWGYLQTEIQINLEAPIHLTALLLSHLREKSNANIINITSGLGFVPYAAVPIYSATKAGIHSFTLSLRHQLKNSGIGVLEIIPPAVNTDLGGKGLHTYGVDVKEFTLSVMNRLVNDEMEVGFGSSEEVRFFGKPENETRFKRMNG